jgi:hypothetical protein
VACQPLLQASRKGGALMTTFSMSLFKTPIRHVQAHQADVPTTHFGHDDGCINVRGEPVFSVMAASWFCEKSG